MEFSHASNKRSASLDVRRGREAAKKSSGDQPGGALPNIGGAGGLPGLAVAPSGGQPTIVLPHSEPLTDDQKKQNSDFIDLFSLEIMTCFSSQTWSTRQAAI